MYFCVILEKILNGCHCFATFPEFFFCMTTGSICHEQAVWPQSNLPKQYRFSSWYLLIHELITRHNHELIQKWKSKAFSWDRIIAVISWLCGFFAATRIQDSQPGSKKTSFWRFWILSGCRGSRSYDRGTQQPGSRKTSLEVLDPGWLSWIPVRSGQPGSSVDPG